MAGRPQMRRMLGTLETSLRAAPTDVGGSPEVALIVSGHWEGPEFAVMTRAHRPIVCDCCGFPPSTDKTVYPAPGAVELAELTADLIRAAGLTLRLDDNRGFDRRAFAPLAVMFAKGAEPT